MRTVPGGLSGPRGPVRTFGTAPPNAFEAAHKQDDPVLGRGFSEVDVIDEGWQSAGGHSYGAVKQAGPLKFHSLCHIPSAFHPISYGIKDVTAEPGAAPVAIRFLYPSVFPFPGTSTGRIDRTDLPLVSSPACPATCPLVLFFHGNSPGHENRFFWTTPLAALAKSGYIVAVPEIADYTSYMNQWGLDNFNESDPWEFDHTHIAIFEDILNWVLYASPFAPWITWSALLEPGAVALPEVALAGHSYGAMAAALLAYRDERVHAYAAIDGHFVEQGRAVDVLPLISVPKVFMVGHGSQLEDTYYYTPFIESFQAGPPIWDRVNGPKHAAVFNGAGHWDFVPPGFGGYGGCDSAWLFASDLLTMFVAKYVETGYTVINEDSLVPPHPGWLANHTITPLGYLDGHLQGASHLQCSVDLSWVAWLSSGTTTVGP
jgi:pimeloyl-ACP methyl ester carboxylesterase